MFCASARTSLLLQFPFLIFPFLFSFIRYHLLLLLLERLSTLRVTVLPTGSGTVSQAEFQTFLNNIQKERLDYYKTMFLTKVKTKLLFHIF